MNILILSNTLTGGGAERVAVNIADGLAKYGHQVTLCCKRHGEITYQPSNEVNLQFYPPSFLGKFHGLRNWYNRIFYIRKQIIKNNPRVIIGIMSINSFQAKIAQLLTFKRIPIIFSEHNPLERPENDKLSFIQKFYKFYFSRLCDAYTVLTEADKKFGIKKGLKNLYVFPNPLAINAVKCIPTKNKTILACGRLNDIFCKGFDILIQSWSKIANRHPQWNLKIAGAGTESDQTKMLKIIQEYGITDRVELLGYKKNIEEIYKQSEIFVLSSRYEGFGLVIIESMSQGCACIAADYKGRQSEIITDGFDGLICKTEDVNDLADKMDILIKNTEFRVKLQQNAIKSVSRFSIDEYAKKWNILINEITQS